MIAPRRAETTSRRERLADAARRLFGYRRRGRGTVVGGAALMLAGLAAGCAASGPSPGSSGQAGAPATVPAYRPGAAVGGGYPWTYASAADPRAAHGRNGGPFPYDSVAAPSATSIFPVAVMGGAGEGGEASSSAFASVPPAPAAIAAAAPLSPAPSRVGGVVFLDAGHGGQDGGAEGVAANGQLVREKDVALAVVLETGRLLAARGVDVRYTRRDDRFIPLDERSRIVNRVPGAIFVSVHVNATKTGQNRPGWMVAGIETYTLAACVTDETRAQKAVLARHGGVPAAQSAGLAGQYLPICRSERTKSERLARLVQRDLVRATGDEDRGVKEKDLSVLRETLFGPAILAEIGFVSHAPTAAKLSSPAYRSRIALALADGVSRYLANETAPLGPPIRR